MPAELAPHLDESAFIHILRDKRKLWRPMELAEALGISNSFIYQLLHSGDLEGHSLGKRKEGFRPRGIERGTDLFAEVPQRRMGLRITRRSVLRYLMESAEYDLSAKDWAEYLVCLIPNLPNNVLDVVRQKIAQVIAVRGLK